MAIATTTTNERKRVKEQIFVMFKWLTVLSYWTTLISVINPPKFSASFDR